MSDGHTDRKDNWYQRKQQQAASSAVRTTLCTYEAPAAWHDIVAWKDSMEEKGRIHQWLLLTNGMIRVLITDGSDRALPNVIEEMVICPLRGHPGGLLATDFMEMARSRDWGKWIHFGKMLLTPEQYRVASSRVANLRQPRQRKQLGSEGI